MRVGSHVYYYSLVDINNEKFKENEEITGGLSLFKRMGGWGFHYMIRKGISRFDKSSSEEVVPWGTLS